MTNKGTNVRHWTADFGQNDETHMFLDSGCESSQATHDGGFGRSCTVKESYAEGFSAAGRLEKDITVSTAPVQQNISTH